MAINKTVNKSTKTHGAMRNCMEYVLRESKINSSLVYVSGPFEAEEITYDTVYRSFLEEKKLWNKDSGRMYAHNIISWHKDEEITPEEAYEFGKEFLEQWFEGFQTLMAVHVDRNHIHLHMITNTVSYIDGHKLHSTKGELEEMKQLTNRMCEARRWSIPEKGKDFYGNDLEMGHVRAWSKDKYHMLLHNAKESYVAACALAMLEAKADACSQDDFIRNMKQKGWHVIWKPSRKNITFVNEEGKKVRDRNIHKTFNINVTKGELLDEFIRNNERRNGVLRDDEEERIRRKQKMQNLQDTISKCKTLLKEQAQVIAQKDLKISQMEKLCLEKDAAYARLLQQKAEQKERLERKIESERSSYRYLNSRLRETEEELADVKEQLPWWKKERKKKSKLCYYKKHWWQSNKFKANVVMGIILAGYICVVWWLFKWSLGR